LINYISSLLGEIKLVNFGPRDQKVIDAHADPPEWAFFGILNFGP